MKSIPKHVRISDYKPLIIIITIILVSSLSISIGSNNSFMNNFMGLFFIIFSLFKFFNISAFVKGFIKYDILTQKHEIYGFIYPYIELMLGCMYLSNKFPIQTNIVTLFIMIVSSYSVLKSIKSGLNLKCACLGTSLNVPLSTVSLLENISMGLMSFYNLVLI